MKTQNKISYVEHLRVAAAMAVVFLHVVVTLNTNHSPDVIGVAAYTVFSDLHMTVKWAVPCFLMITGALLLDPGRELTVQKVIRYLTRMLAVLATFGVVYALMELVFSEKTVSIQMALQAIYNTAAGKSWSHMWYIYELIALYILAIPLKAFVSSQDEKTISVILALLIVGNFVIPTVNGLFQLSIMKVAPISEYSTYFLLGACLNKLSTDKYRRNWCAIGAVVSTLVMVVVETWSLLIRGEGFPANNQSGQVLVLIQSVSVFLLFRKCFAEKPVGAAVNAISEYSFGIYLIHPLWINLLNKVIGITPLSFPIVIGIPVLFLTVFFMSLASVWVVKKLPILRKIV